MKKILLSITAAGLMIPAFAQQPSFDFETWTGTGASIEPSGWISENAATILGNPQSVFQATSPDIHAGTYAIKIASVTMTTPISGLPNPIGLAATGQISGLGFKLGFASTARPATASFWVKYVPVASDSAECLIALWNHTTHDTIAVGYWHLGTSVSTYTQQNVTLNYNPAFSAEFPDSMVVAFSSTKLFNHPHYTLCMNCGTAGDTLWVDDIAFSGWNGVNEQPSSQGVILYPNPANEFANISVDAADAVSAIVYDATGRVVAKSSLDLLASNKKSGKINTSNLAVGLYSYSIMDKTGTALRAGKFSVVR